MRGIPEQFIDLANTGFEDWPGDIDREVLIRTSVNRLYLGSYLMVREYLGVRDKSEMAHQSAIRKLKRADWAAGESLRFLLGLRKEADYHLTPGFNLKKLRLSRKRAGHVRGALKRLGASGRRSKSRCSR